MPRNLSCSVIFRYRNAWEGVGLRVFRSSNAAGSARYREGRGQGEGPEATFTSPRASFTSLRAIFTSPRASTRSLSVNDLPQHRIEHYIALQHHTFGARAGARPPNANSGGGGTGGLSGAGGVGGPGTSTTTMFNNSSATPYNTQLQPVGGEMRMHAGDAAQRNGGGAEEDNGVVYGGDGGTFEGFYVQGGGIYFQGEDDGSDGAVCMTTGAFQHVLSPEPSTSSSAHLSKMI